MAIKGVFDIIGPVMIGPSSSHTAGAARIGKMARFILGERPIEAEITLYGSFAQTYQGHGTDRALVAGLLGMNTDDVRLKDSLEIAKQEGLTYQFKFAESHHVHPNTAAILLKGESGKESFIEGCSVGGGNISITEINKFSVEVTGKYQTLLVEHLDRPGTIGRVTTALGIYDINIGEMRMARNNRGDHNFVVIETDQKLTEDIVKAISSLPHINSVIKIDPI